MLYQQNFQFMYNTMSVIWLLGGSSCSVGKAGIVCLEYTMKKGWAAFRNGLNPIKFEARNLQTRE